MPHTVFSYVVGGAPGPTDQGSRFRVILYYYVIEVTSGIVQYVCCMGSSLTSRPPQFEQALRRKAPAETRSGLATAVNGPRSSLGFRV